MPKIPVSVPELTPAMAADLRRCVDRWDCLGLPTAIRSCVALRHRGLIVVDRWTPGPALWAPTDLGRAALAAHEARTRKGAKSP